MRASLEANERRLSLVLASLPYEILILVVVACIFLIISFPCFQVFGQEELYHSLWPVLHKLYQQIPECEPFLQPVDADKLGIPVSLPSFGRGFHHYGDGDDDIIMMVTLSCYMGIVLLARSACF